MSWAALTAVGWAAVSSVLRGGIGVIERLDDTMQNPGAQYGPRAGTARQGRLREAENSGGVRSVGIGTAVLRSRREALQPATRRTDRDRGGRSRPLQRARAAGSGPQERGNGRAVSRVRPFLSFPGILM